jgi:hypothetical protein
MDRFLNSQRHQLRKASTEDIIFIKNELFSILNHQKSDDYSKHIRLLLNEMHYLNIFIEIEDDKRVIYYYEPNKKYVRKAKLNESGWIEIDK